MALNAGVVQQDGVIHIRGGRTGEIAFYVDGASVTNPLFAADDRQGVSVIQEAIEEFQLQSGGYTAEFGGASSGIARTTVRTGRSQYKFTLDYQTDDFAKPSSKFLGTTAFGFRNAVATVGGPIPYLQRSTFFLAGQHNYLRNSSIMFLTPFRFDSLVADAYNSRGAGEVLPGPVDFKENYFYNNWDQTNTLQGTLLFDLTPLKARLTGSFTDAESPNGHGWPGALGNYFWQVEQLSNTKSLFSNFRLTHVLSTTTFYEVGLSYLKRWAKTYDPDFGEDFESIRSYSDSVTARNLGREIYSPSVADEGINALIGRRGKL
jgi:hypothetical protein